MILKGGFMSSIMLDLDGYELSAEEKEILVHPLVGGIILFTRNYHDPQQLSELVQQVRLHSKQRLLLAVDHEGGRVQRFRDGFSAIPAMAKLSQWDASLETRLRVTETMGWLMAAEVNAFDIDLSFAPVLDLNGISAVIGDRSFSGEPQEVVQYAGAFMQGMKRAGMKATGKHFPGHGSVEADSHIAMPVDNRPKDAIFEADMQPFQILNQQQLLDAIMPAHVVYPAVDQQPAGFSSVWLQDILRQQMQFNGVIFSDDLGMEGASFAGDYADRARAALGAGCDMALVCNNRDGAIAVLDSLPNPDTHPNINPDTQLSAQFSNPVSTQQLSSSRIARLFNPATASLSALQQSDVWQQAQQQLEHFYD